jgi:hypothetical protein
MVRQANLTGVQRTGSWHPACATGLAQSVRCRNVPFVSGDGCDEDSGVATEDLAPLDAGRADRGEVVYSGRARPVVLSDSDLAVLQAVDLTAFPDWIRAADHGVIGNSSGRSVQSGDRFSPSDQRRSFRSLLAHGAVAVLLAMPAVFAVALGIAVAAR